MSSSEAGYGPSGTPDMRNPIWGSTLHHGDCLGFFTEYQKCYVQADIPEKECELWKQDYVECKFHLKEKARLRQIRDQKRLMTKE